MSAEGPWESPEGDELAEAAYLATPRAIRDRAEALYVLGVAGKLAHFAIDESRLDAIAAEVVAVTRAAYPDVSAIPYHSRWRHFAAGGVDRAARLDRMLAGQSREARLAAKLELAITSVLLDAGAGDRWRYQESDGAVFTRSEGLAVASFDLFVRGGLSSDARHAPLRADGAGLAAFTADALARAFQVSNDNEMVGVAGRAAMLRTLGDVVNRKSAYFGVGSPRLGALGTYLASRASETGRVLAASTVLGAVLDALGDIWPSREILAGKNLGDVWPHPGVGRVPLHKLSQWLTYSLFEPLEEYGVTISDVNELTGLAEYRNGGLFVDGGVLVPKQASITMEPHSVSSSVVVEWRGLTVALLDRTADAVRRLLGLTAAELPLAKVLEGGTWQTGRKLAFARRPSGAPPIRVISDGTVF